MPKGEAKTAKAKEQGVVVMLKDEALANVRAIMAMRKLKKGDAKDPVQRFQRWIIDSVSNGEHLYRLVIADALEDYWFPSPHLRRARDRKGRARMYEFTIKHLMKEKGLSREKAKEELALLYAKSVKSVEALDRFLKRVKKEQREGGQKL
jgi:hypothetical protein